MRLENYYMNFHSTKKIIYYYYADAVADPRLPQPSCDRGFVTGYDLSDLSSSSSSPLQKSTLLSYLQHESIQMTKIQQSLMKQLHSKKISSELEVAYY